MKVEKWEGLSVGFIRYADGAWAMESLHVETESRTSEYVTFSIKTDDGKLSTFRLTTGTADALADAVSSLLREVLILETGKTDASPSTGTRRGDSITSTCPKCRDEQRVAWSTRFPLQGGFLMLVGFHCPRCDHRWEEHRSPSDDVAGTGGG